MELKKGTYVRTRYGIAKITNLSKTIGSRGFYLDREFMDCNEEDWKSFCTIHDIIGEPSYNIFDLIEEHDILLLLDKEYDENYKAEVVLDGNDFKVIVNYEQSDLLNLEYELITEEHIKLLQIVTKEQFESMSYKVGE